ncbi:hypothetical protein L6164_018743 [Bauhinia variegata]|uniref:Uncharacterized protein n=1 Tax=Bauhinia variegata TaxID=167791 RepID=A0ACB9NC52_BAUVA|nr:hypothetical protein L6164_018743 [Bauhinia variegata]
MPPYRISVVILHFLRKMGSCLSKGKIPKQDHKCNTPKQDLNEQNGLKIRQSHLISPAWKPNRTNEDESRPPPQVEEETVKEVLSETSISKPQIPVLVEEGKTQMPISIVERQAENFDMKCLIHKPEEASEVSQLSEICSISESFSTCTTATTTTITENREDEATSKRSSRKVSQRVNRSPSKAPRKDSYTVDSTSTKERKAKSPARRTETSPERKSQVSSRSSVRGSETGPMSGRKLSVGSAGVRSDPSEGSCRQSRSPSTGTVSGVSKAITGRTPLKATRGAGRLSPADHSVKHSGNAKVVEKKGSVSQGTHESLENPHVSLECFIFL